MSENLAFPDITFKRARWPPRAITSRRAPHDDEFRVAAGVDEDLGGAPDRYRAGGDDDVPDGADGIAPSAR